MFRDTCKDFHFQLVDIFHLLLLLGVGLQSSFQIAANGEQVSKLNPASVERCVQDVVGVAKALATDESRFFRAVSGKGGEGKVCAVGGECEGGGWRV